ncbi:hypothetical protein [Parasitella parasitica]|uniref:Reverse transcriptase domain-containing protein n=1 Tax=Parasitella parasitica TaxID=35722 RepID=A0A0B7NSX1_9FUNG|nr:hypothetical protein [Parasitella parasitica]
MEVANQIINPYQLDFMPGKYIAQNGLMVQMILKNASCFYDEPDHHHLGLLLDQQKAYDRVNLEYLETVLLHYGFPTDLVRTLYVLFKYNCIRTNVNGVVSTREVSELRGLKQGDPISCILYNFALEPLLRSILDDPLFHGYHFYDKHAAPGAAALPPIKLLCYADDTLVFLQDEMDLHRMVLYLRLYSAASNAQINYHKVQAVFLPGKNQDEYWLPRLTAHGLRLPCTRLAMSVLERATIANFLLLSKCWYLLTVVPSPASVLQAVQQIVSSFVNTNFSPRLSWQLIVTAKKHGGLGVLNPTIQQKALYYRWIDPLLFSRGTLSSSEPYIFIAAHVRNTLDGSHLPLLLLFLDARRSLAGSPLSTTSMLIRSVNFTDLSF